jgi:hypothetical protein
VLAIVTSSWISNSFGGSVDEGESLVEIWAVLKSLDSEVWKSWSIVWEVVTVKLGKALCITKSAVVSKLWISNWEGLTILKELGVVILIIWA